MIYYIFLALIDIGLFLSDNWKELSFTALASGIGVIVGRRIGTRLAYSYALRLMGIRHKSTLEKKVEWLIQQEETRGNPWSAESSTLKPSTAKTLFTKLQTGLYLAHFTIASIPRWGIKKLTLRRKSQMREYLKKLGSRKFQSFVAGFATQLFILLKVDSGPYVDMIAAAGLIITTIVYIWVEGSIDKGGSHEPDYTKSDSTSE